MTQQTGDIAYYDDEGFFYIGTYFCVYINYKYYNFIYKIYLQWID